MKPSGVQFARPMRPPARKTRSISSAHRAWSGVNIAPNVESTTSKLRSSKGKSSASATWNRTSRPSAMARWRPLSSSAGT
jgi:hypothetical protein